MPPLPSSRWVYIQILMSVLLLSACGDEYKLEEKHKELVNGPPSDLTLIEQGKEDSTEYRVRTRLVYFDEYHDLFQGLAEQIGELEFRNDSNRVSFFMKARENDRVTLRFIHEIGGRQARWEGNWKRTAIGEVAIDGRSFSNVHYISNDEVACWFTTDHGVLKIEHPDRGLIFLNAEL